MIIRIINKISSIYTRFKWTWDTISERSKIRVCSIDTSFPIGKKLVLLPHVDDEWIGCSQALLQSHDIVLCDMDMPGGDSTEIHKKRKMELNNLANLLNIPLVTIGRDKPKSLVDIIIKTNCDQIFVPFFIDWHKDHLEVIKLLKLALYGVEKKVVIIAYQVSIPISRHNINIAIPMNKFIWHEKWKEFKIIYPSQLHIPYKRFSLHERINGAYIGAYAAEVYCIMSKEKWLALSKSYIISPLEQKCFISNLNDISKLHKVIGDYYTNHNLK